MSLIPTPSPGWPPGLETVRDELDAHVRANPYLTTLGADVVDWGLGWARVQMVARPEHANLVGSVHGGVVASLADSAFEIACNSYGRVCVALELGVHFTAPAPLGVPLLAEAREVSRSRRTASYHVSVAATGPQGDGEEAGEEAGGGGTTLAWFMALAFRTDRWHLGEDRYPDDWRRRY